MTNKQYKIIIILMSIISILGISLLVHGVYYGELAKLRSLKVSLQDEVKELKSSNLDTTQIKDKVNIFEDTQIINNKLSKDIKISLEDLEELKKDISEIDKEIEVAQKKLRDYQSINSDDIDVDITEKTNIEEGIIKILQSASIDSFTFDDKPISSIEWIKLIETNSLRTISLKNTKIKDITPLKTQNSLVGVYLENCDISNIDVLSKLPNIVSLKLTGTNTRSLTPITNLNKIYLLEIGKTKVTNLKVLKGLKKLKILNIDQLKIPNLTPLYSLPRLEALSIVNSEFNFDEIKELKSLKTLVVGRTDSYLKEKFPNLRVIIKNE